MSDLPELERMLLELRASYAASLPSKLGGIEAAMRDVLREPGNRQCLARLHAQLHSLTGSAGTFGFAGLGELARELEQRCDAWLEGAGCNQDDLARLQASLARMVMLAT